MLNKSVRLWLVIYPQELTKTLYSDHAMLGSVCKAHHN